MKFNIDFFQAKHIATEKEMLLAQNKSLAEWNLAQEPKLREAKARLVDVYEQAAKLKEEAESKKTQLSKFFRIFDTRELGTRWTIGFHFLGVFEI